MAPRRVAHFQATMACGKQSSGLADVNGSDEPTIKAELPASGPSAPATAPVSLGLGAPAVARAELEQGPVLPLICDSDRDVRHPLGPSRRWLA